MKAISQGDNTYDIFDDSLRVYDQLPAQPYVVRCNDKRGFFLIKYSDMEINEPKVYGVHDEKVNKVLRSFRIINRSLGVILSGDKGIGKSLFAKILANKSVQLGLPVIVVDTYYPGIASYIESIEQEVMILFDEFDKTFGDVKSRDGQASPQTHLLSLFDGISPGKKLFVVTCNDLRKLNDYLINRPGRFHYHFRFEYPSASEIKQYLYDNLQEECYGEIENVISFAGKINLNYDCLRAIAFELNSGITFAEAIKDLNIVNIEKEHYDIALRYANGFTAAYKNAYLDMFNDESETIYLYDNHGNNFVDVQFTPTDSIFDNRRRAHIILPENLKLTYDYDSDYCKESVEIAKSSEVEYMTISRKVKKGIHYAV